MMRDLSKMTQEEIIEYAKRLQADQAKLQAQINNRPLSKAEQIEAWNFVCPGCRRVQPDPKKWNSVLKQCLVCGECYLIGLYLGLRTHAEIHKILTCAEELKNSRQETPLGGPPGT